MTIDQMEELLKEAPAECSGPSVQEVIVDKLWDDICDRNGDFWIA
jgi:hypothetical protein